MYACPRRFVRMSHVAKELFLVHRDPQRMRPCIPCEGRGRVISLCLFAFWLDPQRRHLLGVYAAFGEERRSPRGINFGLDDVFVTGNGASWVTLQAAYTTNRYHC